MPGEIRHSRERQRARAILDVRLHRRLHSNQRKLSNVIAKLAATVVTLAAFAQAADPPAPVIALFRSITEELATPDAELFFDHFDKSMPGFQALKTDVEALLVYGYIVSTLELSSDAG